MVFLRLPRLVKPLKRPDNTIPGDSVKAPHIEMVGFGTLHLIARCRAVGLPEPAFEQRARQFVTTVWRDWLTNAVMNELGLS